MLWMVSILWTLVILGVTYRLPNLGNHWRNDFTELRASKASYTRRDQRDSILGNPNEHQGDFQSQYIDLAY